MRTKTEAIKEGGILLAKMRGDGWALEVWENLGWHYSVRNGCLSVYPTVSKYSCLMGRCGGGETIWSIRQSYNDPNDAVDAQIAEAQKVIDGLTNMLQQAKKAALPHITP